MCRMILYIAKLVPIPLGYIVYDAPHSLARQSYKDPYLPGIKPFPDILKRNPKINMDGFGIYYVDMEDPNKIQCTKSKYSIINPTFSSVDPIFTTFEKNKEKDKGKDKEIDNFTIRNNLYKSIKPILEKNIIYNLSFIRNNNFKETRPNHFRDVQPYRYKNYLFCHNGGFNTEYSKYTSKLVKYIDPLFLEKMENINIDSKWVFGLLLSQVDTSADTETIRSQVEQFLLIMHKIKDIGFNISLNILLSDLDRGVHLALRYRTCEQVPPAMYYNKIHPLGYFIASEPIDYKDGWHLMHNQLIVIRPSIKHDYNSKYIFTSVRLEPQEIKCVMK